MSRWKSLPASITFCGLWTIKTIPPGRVWEEKKIIVIDTHCYFVAKHIEWNVMIQTVKIRTLIWLLERLHLKKYQTFFSNKKKQFISLEFVLQLNFLFISQFVLALKNSICPTKPDWVQGFIHCTVLD